MKQVIQNIRNGDTRVVEVPVPAVRQGMVLVRTSASLVSAGTERSLIEFTSKSLIGKALSRPDLVRQVMDKAQREGILSTLDAVRNRMDQPLPLGYSSAGVVVEVGEGVSGFRAGDRVACAGGGYAVHAEYVVVPVNLVAKLPDGVSFESGAFGTLGAIALHGFRLAEPTLGENIAIIGLGVLGLLAAQVASAAGCKVLGVDTNIIRVDFAREHGLEAVLRDEAPEAGDSFTQGFGFDVVQICADTPSDDTVELAGEIARDRGRVVVTGVVGTYVPRATYYAKEIRFIVSRSYGPGRYDLAYEEGGIDYPISYVRWTEGRNLAAFLDLILEGRVSVEPLISHRFSLDDAEGAYDLISGTDAENSIGVLLTYPEGTTEADRGMRKMEIRPTPRESVDTIRLGVIGAGNFARAVMLPVLKKTRNLELIGIASATGMNASGVGKKFGFQYATTDVRDLLSDEGINTVAILTRHNMHAGTVISAIEAGKHVFCEKPLAIKREELTDISSALEKSDRMMTIGFNRRYSPFSQKLKAFFNPLDDPMMIHYRINAGALPADHWLHDPDQGGGRIIGEACHFIDFLVYITDQLPQTVYARGLPDDRRFFEDNVTITIGFPDGSVGVITYIANGDRTLPKERVEIFSGGRAGVLDDFRRLELYAGGRKRSHRSWLRQDKGHTGEWENFTSAILKGDPPPIPYEQIFSVSYTSIAAIDALRSGEIQVVDNRHYP